MDNANAATRRSTFEGDLGAAPPTFASRPHIDGTRSASGVRSAIRTADSVRQTFAGSKYVETATIGERSPMKQGTGVAFHLRMILKK